MKIFYDLVPDTPLGTIWIAVSARGVVAVQLGGTEREFANKVEELAGVMPRRSRRRGGAAARRVKEYLTGRRLRLDLRPHLIGRLTPFRRQVLQAAARIPRGGTATYGEIARRLGRPGAARAVGQALRNNPLPLVIPCHRVIAAKGAVGGYSGGVRNKIWLLKLENASWEQAPPPMPGR